ncbi:MAG: glycosyl hydrolase family 25 [Lachnospiraceae bacterium]|nr:glycosyl hydrolase family 25 [Lachnospiraceae bacterium]
MKGTKTGAKTIKTLIVVLIIAALAAGLAFLMQKQLLNRLFVGSRDVCGVDVSHYQGEIDWQKLNSQGIRFAYIKATEGSSYTDDYYAINLAGAKEAGIVPGAYHFFSFDSPAETQAQHFIDVVGDLDGELIPVIDVEFYGNSGNNPPDKDELKAHLSEMLDILEEHYGCKPVIYSTFIFYHEYLYEGFEDYPLWLRNVYFPPFEKCAVWQYTSRLRLDGFNGAERYIDGDVLKGVTLEEMTVKAEPDE